MIEHMTMISSYEQIPLDLYIMAPAHPRGIITLRPMDLSAVFMIIAVMAKV